MIIDLVVTILVLPYLFDYLVLLFLQFLVVIVIWQSDRIGEAATIGILVGIIPTVLAFLYASERFGIPWLGLSLSLSFGTPMGFVGGIIGAFIGRKWKKTKSSTLIGAVLGTLIGIGGLLLASKLFDIQLGLPCGGLGC